MDPFPAAGLPWGDAQESAGGVVFCFDRNQSWMPKANSPIAARAKIPVPRALKPTTRVLTAAAMRRAVKLSEASGLLAKA